MALPQVYHTSYYYSQDPISLCSDQVHCKFWPEYDENLQGFPYQVGAGAVATAASEVGLAKGAVEMRVRAAAEMGTVMAADAAAGAVVVMAWTGETVEA